jgi:hypothetical protein
MKSPDAAIAAQLLGNALADAPGKDTLREWLFRALTAVKRDRLALSSMEPLLRSGFLDQPSGRYSRDYEQEAGAEDASSADAADAPVEAEPDTPPRVVASANERAALTIEVANCYARLDALEISLRYYRRALGLKLSSEARAEVIRSANRVRATIRRNANNALRIPSVHKAVEQEHLVRPRLVAGLAAPPAAQAERGSKGGGAR